MPNFLPGLALLATLPAVAADCDSPARCNQLGTAAYQAGRLPEAIVLFEAQVDYAEATEGDTDDLQAYNNAALAWHKSGHCLAALAFLDVATHLTDSGPDRATKFNQGKIEAACQAELQQQEVAGEYWQYIGGARWNALKVEPGNPGEMLLALDAFYASRRPVREFGTNIGWLRATGKVDANGQFEGSFATDLQERCWLKAQFGPRQVELEQEGGPHSDCGFGGHNVGAGGRYLQVQFGSKMRKPLAWAGPPDEF